MRELLRKAQSMQEDMVDWRRYIHEHPEVGEELPGTVKFVKSKLREFGYQPVEISRGSLLATIKGNVAGKCILIREDMDALPICEKAEIPFKSHNGYMHACGHDMHTAMLLACAKLLMDYRERLKGTVKLLFQADEEGLCGAEAAIKAGVLENPKVDAAYTLHVDAMSPWNLGVLTMAQPGVILSSCDVYHIDIVGKGGHGAYPNQAIDPINVGAHIHTALQEIVSRELCASDEAVLTQGIFRSGDAPNIIPHTAHLEGTLRTYDETVRNFCKKRIEEISKDVARTFRAEATVTFVGECASFVNDAEVFSSLEKYLKELVGEEKYVHEGEAGVCFASEDFANVSRCVPSVQLGLVVGSTKEGAAYPMHHPKVVFDEEPMYVGAAALTYAAVRYLEEHGV